MKININNLSTKTYISILTVIIILGGIVIITPRIVSSNIEKKEAVKIAETEENIYQKLKVSESTEETIEDDEGIVFEPELYSENQMYFDNIDVLYDNFTINEVELIKEKVEIYVSRYIQDVRDCRVLDGVYKNEEMVSFEIELSNNESLEIKVKKDNPINPLDNITILHITN